MRRDTDIKPGEDGGSSTGDGGRAALPFAMVITDPNLPDNPIVYVNKAFERVTQYTADYAIGRNCRFLQGEHTSKASVAKIREGLERGGDFTVDIVNYRADGSTFLNRLLIAPLPTKEGGPANYLGIQRVLPDDGTAPSEADDPGKKRAQDMADAARDGAAVEGEGGSSELLAAIRSGVEQHIAMIISLVRLGEDDDIRALAPRMLGRRIEALQLLYEELDQAGVVSIRDEIVPLGAYLSRVAATLVHLEGRRSIRVDIECDAATAPASVAARLGLLLCDLLLNALRHGFEGRRDGVVSVSFNVLTGRRARLIVQDDGSGMGEEDDWPFTRDETAEDVSEERTGHRVGAKLVRQLIDGLDATIDVRSDRYGTTVEVALELPDRVSAKPRAALS